MIEAVEKALLARLAKALPELKVEAWQDDPATYRLDHPKGAALVRYLGSAYREPLAPDAQSQPRALKWQVTLALRSLRSHREAYALLEAVRLALQGWGAGETGGAFRLAADAFDKVAHGVWTYSVTLEHTLVAVPDLAALGEDPQELTRVTRITAISPPLHETIITQRNL